MEKFNIMKFITDLVSIGERQLEKEDQAMKMIITTLEENGVSFVLHEFDTSVPKVDKATLIVDGKEVPCMASSFVSGKISGKEAIVSSLIPSRYLIEYPNINFNPECDTISRDNHYFAPSIAIDKDGLSAVLGGKEVSAEVAITKVDRTSNNILVGNVHDPENIVFAHYDSVGPGAIDNGSGVGVLMDNIISQPDLKEKNLFIFSGNEELSYDKPTYWGRGFRAFEKDYAKAMDSAKKIIVVDCVGNSKTCVSDDDNLRYLAFPIDGIQIYKDKIFLMYADMESLMEVYHSSLDTPEKLDEGYLEEARNTLLSILTEKI